MLIHLKRMDSYDKITLKTLSHIDGPTIQRLIRTYNIFNVLVLISRDYVDTEGYLMKYL